MNESHKNTIIGVLIFTLIILVSGIFILPIERYGRFIFTLEIFIGVCIFISWYSGRHAFICGACKHRFTIGFIKNAISFHIIKVKYLRCPKCKERTWAKETLS